jgi:hypothetical protein
VTRPTAYRSARLPCVALGAVLVLLLSGCVSAPERAFDSAVFAAREGQDDAGPLGWIDDHPVYWQLEYVDGVYSAVVGPPCAPVNAPVTLERESIVVDMDRATIADVACDGSRAAMDQWVRSFLAEPLDYSLDGETLRLERGGSSLTFERIDR